VSEENSTVIQMDRYFKKCDSIPMSYLAYIKFLEHICGKNYMDTPSRWFCLNFLLAGIKHHKFCTRIFYLLTWHAQPEGKSEH